MTPSGLSQVFARISELQQPPAAVSGFAAAFAGQTAAATTAGSSSTAQVSAATASQPGTDAAAAVAHVAAQRSVTAAVTTPTVTRSALPPAAAKWTDAISAAATRNGVDPDLLTSLVWVESSFQPDAVSPVGAIGLAQLMPDTAKSLGVDPYDPAQNLDGAARMLSGLIKQFGRVDHALAAYNVGPNGFTRGLAEGRTPGAGYAQAVADKYRAITGKELF